jgi:tol-pal system protein YbgF
VNTRLKLVLAVLLVIIAVGPAYPQNKDMLRLEQDVIDLKSQVKVLQSSMDSNNTAMKALVEKMYDQVNTLSSGMQAVSKSVDGLKNQDDASTKEMRTILTTLSGTVNDLQDGLTNVRTQMSSLSKQMTAMKTTAEPLAKPDDLWRTAVVDSLAGNYDLAIADLQDFLSKAPGDSRTAEAHLRIGESLSAQKKFDQAINEYDVVLQKYPDSDTTKSALLKKGYALADLNQTQQAITILKQVQTQFPNTAEATAATAKLKEITPAGRRGQAPAGAKQ